jgi:hypothetical protein
VQQWLIGARSSLTPGLTRTNSWAAPLEHRPGGPWLRPAHALRSKAATLAMTPSDRLFIETEARRRGLTVNRLLGNLVEAAIRRRLFDELLGGEEAANG